MSARPLVGVVFLVAAANLVLANIGLAADLNEEISAKGQSVGSSSVPQGLGNPGESRGEEVWDAAFFLKRLRTLEHLPLLEESHLYLAAPFDQTGGNNFCDWRNLGSDGRNILLDVAGPGCLHRIFGGTSKARIQIFLDHADKPLIDMNLDEFYDEEHGPFPYPLIFKRSYPGCMMPIPFAKHCLVQICSPNPPDYVSEISYTIYPKSTPIQTLTLPLDARTRKEMETTCKVWLQASSSPPAVPANWTSEKTSVIEPGGTSEIALNGVGTIRQIRVAINPATPDVLSGVRLQLCWDGAAFPSVEVPVGYFFGHAEFGHGKVLKSRWWIPQVPWKGGESEKAYTTDYDSMFMGVTATEAYTCFPMPFERGAVIRLVNTSNQRVDKAVVKLDVERQEKLAPNTGRFHATYSEERAATEAVPKFGAQNTPCKMILERRARGKFVGLMLHLVWQYDKEWWGEGDFLIWSDERGWPPSYHGVGSECFFNAGWSNFDRKAASGFVAVKPGHPTQYVYFLNDAVQFQEYIRVAEQYWGSDGGDEIIRRQHTLFGSTAFWYADKPLPAESDPTLLKRGSTK